MCMYSTYKFILKKKKNLIKKLKNMVYGEWITTMIIEFLKVIHVKLIIYGKYICLYRMSQVVGKNYKIVNL
jgi:hypothetical protein